MLLITRNYGPIKIYQKWFFSKPSFKDIFSITVYKQCNTLQNTYGFLRKNFYTLHIDLAGKSKDELFKEFSKTNQLKIKKALKDVVMLYKNNDISAFIKFFNNFANFKRLPFLHIKEMYFYNNNIIFTWIKNDIGPIAAHAYLLDKDAGIVRLLYSATRVRTEEDLDFISRSNRNLHWFDITLFKDEGFNIYDMGGLALNPNSKETEGIDFFKKSFGGTVIEQSHFESLPAFLIKKILKKD
jgi:hypothetical protein